MTTPELEFVFELNAQLAVAADIGPSPYGFRRVIGILAGMFEGPLIRGTLLPGGADWQIIRGDRITELHAHYILRTDDGVLIQARVRGLRHAAGNALERISEGQEVSPSEYYFRIAPVYDAPQGRYEWLNHSVFVGTGERSQQGVRLRIFRLI